MLLWRCTLALHAKKAEPLIFLGTLLCFWRLLDIFIFLSVDSKNSLRTNYSDTISINQDSSTSPTQVQHTFFNILKEWMKLTFYPLPFLPNYLCTIFLIFFPSLYGWHISLQPNANFPLTNPQHSKHILSALTFFFQMGLWSRWRLRQLILT